MFHEQIIGDEGLLAKLRFNGAPLLDEIRLIVRADWYQAGSLDLGFLFICTQLHRAPNELVVRSNPVGRTPFRPAVVVKALGECLVHVDWREKQHALPPAAFLGALCLARLGNHGCNDALDFVP